MRVLMLITNYGIGGAERVFSDHAREFATKHEVEQAVFAGDFVHAYDPGLPSHELGASRLARFVGPVGRLAYRSLELRRLASRRKYDVVVSHMDGANWVNALSMSRARKIFVVHGSILHDARLSGWRQWIRTRVVIPTTYRRADVVVGVSEGIAAELRALGVRNAVAVPNYIDVDAIRNAARQPVDGMAALFDRGHEIIVASARLSPQKNHAALLEVFALVRRTRAAARLLLVGEGELRAALVARARELGLTVAEVREGALPAGCDADVVFAGFQRNPHALVARSTLFVLPSLWEGFPLALCEAMACGTPVVTADCPTGPREIVGEAPPPRRPLAAAEHTARGVLLPLVRAGGGTTDLWSSTIAGLLADGAARRRLADGASAAIARFDRTMVLQRWLRLLEESRPC
jgi:glycosyltransferase involved in cell wall biosynthesis